jgi:hypothetical protein
MDFALMPGDGTWHSHLLATVDAFTPSFDNEGIYEFVESQSDPALKQGIEQREQPGTIRCDKR